MAGITLSKVKENEKVKIYLQKADESFAILGYKEHGSRHASLCANIAGNIMRFLGYDDRLRESARIATYLHDIGHSLGQEKHAHSSAFLAQHILFQMKMEAGEVLPITIAVGSHEDEELLPPNELAAAVILADKTDVHHSRVRKTLPSSFDTHDRVNYACQKSFLRVDKKAMTITLELQINTELCQVMEYFEIFLKRSLVSQRAAKTLNCRFELFINEVKFL